MYYANMVTNWIFFRFLDVLYVLGQSFMAPKHFLIYKEHHKKVFISECCGICDKLGFHLVHGKDTFVLGN